jgi:hypothetical protein
MTRIPVEHRAGWTLLEVLLALTVVALLVALTVPAVQRARASANVLDCQHKLQQLGLAVHDYHGTQRTMPPYASGKGNEVYAGWFYYLAPFLGHGEVAERLRSGQRVERDGFILVTDGRHLPGVYGVPIPLLRCASDPTWTPDGESKTNYLANWYALSDGSAGEFRPAQSFQRLTDGLSNVVLFAEAYGTCDQLPRLAWFSSYFHNFGITQDGLPSDDPTYAPDDFTLFQVRPAECMRWRTQTAHELMLVGSADASVRRVSPAIAPAVWTQALKPNDGGGFREDG